MTKDIARMMAHREKIHHKAYDVTHGMGRDYQTYLKMKREFGGIMPDDPSLEFDQTPSTSTVTEDRPHRTRRLRLVVTDDPAFNDEDCHEDDQEGHREK